MNTADLLIEIGTEELPSSELKALMEAFLDDEQFLAMFSRAPAAKGMHHAYLGGLLEHSLAVASLAHDISGRYADIDRDLLITGALLHDVGKVAELMGGFRNLGIVVATAFSAKVIGSVFTMGRGLWSLSRGLFQVVTSYRATTAATQTATAASKRHILTQKLLNRATWRTVAGLVKQKVATVALATYQRTVSAATKVWAGAQWALNAAMNANPIGLLVTGAAALGGAAYYVINNWNKVKSWFTNLWNWVSSLDLLAGIKQAILTASPVGWLYRAFKPAIQWLSNLSFLQEGKDLIGSLISGLASQASTLYKKVKDMLGPIGSLLPGSDAKEGPLSKLTRAGKAVPQTMAKGVKESAPALKKAAKGAAGGAAAATALAGPALAGQGKLQEQEARIRPVMERAPQLQDQEARARIRPVMDRIPQLQEQQSRARITPVMDRAPEMGGMVASARERGRAREVDAPAAQQQERAPQITINQTINVGESSGEPETEIRRAGQDAAKETRREIDNYFSRGVRLGYA